MPLSLLIANIALICAGLAWPFPRRGSLAGGGLHDLLVNALLQELVDGLQAAGDLLCVSGVGDLDFHRRAVLLRRELHIRHRDFLRRIRAELYHDPPRFLMK
jgi:hypothetical protein